MMSSSPWVLFFVALLRSKRVGAVVPVLVVLVTAKPVLASPGYPQILYERADAECAPPCTVCHETTRGGWNTATKPFARALVHQGLAGNDEETLRVALDYLDADSDGDGVDDRSALRAGVDPNDGAEPLCPIEAGCSVPQSEDGVGLWMLLAVGLVMGWQRRTARSPKKRTERPETDGAVSRNVTVRQQLRANRAKEE